MRRQPIAFECICVWMKAFPCRPITSPTSRFGCIRHALQTATFTSCASCRPLGARRERRLLQTATGALLQPHRPLPALRDGSEGDLAAVRPNGRSDELLRLPCRGAVRRLPAHLGPWGLYIPPKRYLSRCRRDLLRAVTAEILIAEPEHSTPKWGF